MAGLDRDHSSGSRADGDEVSHDIEPLWFLALYLPAAWQWPAIVGMLLLGTGALGLALRLYRTQRDAWRARQVAEKATVPTSAGR